MTKNRFINKGIIFLSLLFIFVPRSFEFISGLRYIYRFSFLVEIIIGFTFFVLTLSAGFRKTINKSFIAILFFLVIYVCNCLIHRGDYNIGYHYVTKLLAIYFFVYYEGKKYPKDFIECLAWYFSILVVINLLFLIVKPDGFATLKVYSADRWYRQFDRVNFLEVDNRLSLPIMFSIVSTLYLGNFTNKYLLCIVSLITGGITYLLTRSGTGIICYLIVSIYIIAIYIRGWKLKSVNLQNLVIAYIISYFLLIYASTIPFIQSIINDVLGKDVTYSGRTFIWADYLIKIAQKPLIGYGNFNSGWVLLWRGIPRNAHNLFFDITFQGGLCLLFSYAIMLGVLLFQVNRINNKQSQLMLVLVFGLFIVMLCESFFDNNYLFLLYALCGSARFFFDKSIEPPKKNRIIRVKWNKKLIV